MHKPRLLTFGAIALLFFAVSALTYSSVFTSEFVTWDDMGLIVENRDVQNVNLKSLAHEFSSYDPELYIPLTFVSYQADKVICDATSACVHTTNVVLHTLNALFVTWILWLLFGTPWICIGLGLLFLVHPLNTEAVAWASGRKDLLSTFFFLLSIVSYLQWRINTVVKKYWLALGLFLLGLLSKVSVITLPVTLLIIDWYEGRKDYRKCLMEKIPFFAFTIIFGIVGMFGKTSIIESSTLLQKILMAAKSTVFYLYKFLLPADLSVMYPYTKVIQLSSADFLIPVVIVAGLIVGTFVLRKKFPIVAAGFAIFLVSVAPSFINFSKGSDYYFASDRYAYMPMIGLLLIIAYFLSNWLRSAGAVRTVKARQSSLSALFVVLLCISAFVTSANAKVWQTSKSLYEQTLSVYPNARAAHNNLGMEYLRMGEPGVALLNFDAALAVRSDPRTLINRATALSAMGKTNEAIAEYNHVIQLAPELPDTYFSLGAIYQKQGKFELAVEHYKKALERNPEYGNALNNLGALYIHLEQWGNAVEILEKTVELHPDFVESYYNVAGAYEMLGNKERAEENYVKALELNPNDPDALSHLAALLYEKKDIDGAAQLLQRALEIDSSNPKAIELVLQMKKDGVAE